MALVGPGLVRLNQKGNASNSGKCHDALAGITRLPALILKHNHEIFEGINRPYRNCHAKKTRKSNIELGVTMPKNT